MTAVIRNPAGAFGASVTGSERGHIIVPMMFTTTVSKGQVVSLSSAASRVIKTLTDTAVKLQIGIALEDTAAESEGLVCVYGPATALKTAAAMTAGDIAQRDGTTAASVSSLAGTTAITQLKDAGVGIGIVMASVTAGDATVELFVGKF